MSRHPSTNTERRTLVIANRNAGGSRRKTADATHDFLQYLSQKNINSQLINQPDAHLAGDEIKKSAHGYDSVVVLGGDGSLNFAVNNVDINLPLGIVPIGTGNDFITNLTLPRARRAIYACAVEGDICTVDSGLCNNRRFVNGVGLGLDASVVKAMEDSDSRFLSGHALYY